RMWTADSAHAQKTLDEIAQGFEIALADRIFSQDGSSMEEVVAGLLTQHNSTISAAESCTGGLLAQRLTSIAGSSSYCLGGVVIPGDREAIRWHASQLALDLVRIHFLYNGGEPPSLNAKRA